MCGNFLKPFLCWDLMMMITALGHKHNSLQLEEKSFGYKSILHLHLTICSISSYLFQDVFCFGNKNSKTTAIMSNSIIATTNYLV